MPRFALPEHLEGNVKTRTICAVMLCALSVGTADAQQYRRSTSRLRCAPVTPERCEAVNTPPNSRFEARNDACAETDRQACIRGMSTALRDEPTQPVAVSREIQESGLLSCIDAGDFQEEAHYSADPLSLESQFVAAEFTGVLPLSPRSGIPNEFQARDPYEAWERRHGASSCNEYAYERYYELNRFLREVAAGPMDPRRIIAIAFGGGPAAFGTHHRFDLDIHSHDEPRGRRATPVATLPYETHPPTPQTAPKNAFFWLANRPQIGAAPVGRNTGRAVFVAPGVQHAPGLFDALRAHSEEAAAYLDMIADSRQADAPGSDHYERRVYPRNLDYDAWWYAKMVADRTTPDPSSTFAPQIDDTLVLVGSGTSGGPRGPGSLTNDATDETPDLGYVASVGLRRYLWDELNAFDQMQQEVYSLSQRWQELNRHWADSDWTVEELRPEPLVLVGAFAQTPSSGQNTTFASTSPGSGSGGSGSSHTRGANFATEATALATETAQRRAIVERLRELLARGAEIGCLEEGVTPCDWSPNAFIRRVLRSTRTARAEAYRYCESVADGLREGSGEAPSVIPWAGLLGEDINYDPGRIPAADFTLAVGDSFTHADLRNFRVLRAAIASRMATEQALDNLLATSSGLVDPLTRQPQNPGFRRSQEESMGNKWFGLSYGYDFGYGIDLMNGICQADGWAGAGMHAELKVLGRSSELFSAVNHATTDAHDRFANQQTSYLVDMHLRVLGQDLYVPQQVSPSEEEHLSFHGTVEGSKSMEVARITSTFMVGPVPLSLSAGAAFEAGLRGSLAAEARLPSADNNCFRFQASGEIAPFIAAKGFVEAAVNLLIVRAGIRGEITILDASLPFSLNLGLSENPNAVSADSWVDGGNYRNLHLWANTDLSLRLRTLDGHIGVFAEVGLGPWRRRISKTLIDWNGPSWERSLYNNQWDVDIDDVIEVFNQ